VTDAKSRYAPKDIQERTFRFGIRIVKLVNRLLRDVGSVEVARQLVRSGTSVGANVQEADGAESHSDFIHKIKIARKEAQESRFWLHLLKEIFPQTDSEIIALCDEADQLVRILYTISHPQPKRTE